MKKRRFNGMPGSLPYYMKKAGLTLAAALTAAALLTACGGTQTGGAGTGSSVQAGGSLADGSQAGGSLADGSLAGGSQTGGSQTAAGNPDGTAAANKRDTLNIGISAEPATLDPHIQSGQATRLIKQQIYRGLMTYQKDSGIAPDVAASYTISDDNLTYTFVLRDATFQDGSPVTAEDVKFSIDRVMDESVAATFGSDFRSVVDHVSAPDKKTVQIVLKKPCAPFLEYLCLPEASIVSKAFCEAHHNDLSTAAMGCGPYAFDSWDHGLSISVSAYSGWYGTPVQTQNLDFLFYPDETTRANALRTGEVDLIDYVPAKETIAFEKAGDADVEVSVAPFMCLQINCKPGSPLADPRVRQAISYAINRDDVINTAFMGRGKPIFGFPTITGQNGYDGKYDHFFSYDPDKAKKLLAEAGYPDGFSCRLLASSTYAMHEQTAVCVQSSLAKVGIKAELELPDWATRIQRSNTGDYDLMVSGTAGNIVDMDWAANYYESGDVRMNSCPGFSDPQIDQLLDKGRTTLDEKQREQIYDQFRQRALELSPFVFINYREQVFATSKKVHGFQNLPGILTYLSGLTLQDTYVEQ